MRFGPWIALLLAAGVLGPGCSCEGEPQSDGGVLTDGGARDTGALDVLEVPDGGADAAIPSDAEQVDGSVDPDASTIDGGSGSDAGVDAGSDAGVDAGHDAGGDAGPIDPCTPLPSGLMTFMRSDSASVGTPDTYFIDVTPGAPFCASITGGGGGSWSINVSNGTSSGIYCSGSDTCSIVVPAGQTTLLVTAVTDDIGFYTLTVRYR